MRYNERKRARGSLLTLGERRMAIMIAAKAASSTAGANHDIMSVSEWELYTEETGYDEK